MTQPAAADLPVVVSIFGPTGSGKTDVAVHVARKLGTEVVNADPAQCYAGLPILTNKPAPEHDAIAPHRMVGVWQLDDDASVAAYAEQAHREIEQLIASHGSAVVCGGSGLYLRGALSDLSYASDPDLDQRAELDERYEQLGSAAAHGELARLDPAAASQVHPNDRKRVVRSWQAALAGDTVAPAGSTIWNRTYRHPTLAVGLVVERSLIHQRIETRTRQMFERGVVQEVAEVVGVGGEHADRLSRTARRIHGISDCVGVLQGATDPQDAIAQLIVRTRQYAKRQDTWARKWQGLVRVPVGDTQSTGVAVAATLRAAQRQSAL